MPCTSTVTGMEVLSCCLLCFVCFFCLVFPALYDCLQLNHLADRWGCVVYQGLNQTNQDSIKHVEPEEAEFPTKGEQDNSKKS